MQPIIAKIQNEQLKEGRKCPPIGASVRVHTIVKEGEKERVQIFAGIVIARRGSKLEESFTVRRISYGEGVERVFPVHSPRIAKIDIESLGRVRRAKLYFLRDRQGKAAMSLKEKRTNRGKAKASAAKAAPKAEAAQSAAAEAAPAAE
jgi:large subunit ribosomal protein L19